MQPCSFFCSLSLLVQMARRFCKPPPQCIAKASPKSARYLIIFGVSVMSSLDMLVRVGIAAHWPGGRHSRWLPTGRPSSEKPGERCALGVRCDAPNAAADACSGVHGRHPVEDWFVAKAGSLIAVVVVFAARELGGRSVRERQGFDVALLPCRVDVGCTLSCCTAGSCVGSKCCSCSGNCCGCTGCACGCGSAFATAAAC